MTQYGCSLDDGSLFQIIMAGDLNVRVVLLFQEILDHICVTETSSLPSKDEKNQTVLQRIHSNRWNIPGETPGKS